MKNLKEFFQCISTDENGKQFAHVCNKHLEILPHKSFKVKEYEEEKVCKLIGCKNASSHLIYFN